MELALVVKDSASIAVPAVASITKTAWKILAVPTEIGKMVARMTEKKIIMRDSDEAASIKTVTGWVSSDGRWWGDDERTARYAGCTHERCACGEVIEKSRMKCNACRRKEDREKFEKLEKVVWDGQPLVTDDDDHYFFTIEDLLDYCADIGMQPQDLQLRICKPQYGREIGDDYFCDELAEDGEVPDSVHEAMGILNKAIKDAGPLSWFPSKYAAIIPDEYKVEIEDKAEENA
jgi:hypothetical protein